MSDVVIGDRKFRCNTSLSTHRGLRYSVNAWAPDLSGGTPPPKYNDVRLAKGPEDREASIFGTLDNKTLAPPVDQTECGQCYIVSTVQHLRDIFSRTTNTKFERLSVLYILANVPSGCDGGSPIDVNDFIFRHGIVPDDLDGASARGGLSEFSIDYFNGPLHRKAFGQDPPMLEDALPRLRMKMKDYIDRHRDVRFYRTNPTVSVFADDDERSLKSVESKNVQVKRYIMEYGSAVIAIPVRKDFQDYWTTTGKEEAYVTDPSSRMIGGHAISVVGWHDGPPYDYWVVRNSWGIETGPLGNGFGRIAMFIPGGRHGKPEVNREMWLGAHTNGLGGILALHPRPQTVSRASIALPFSPDADCPWPRSAVVTTALLGAALLVVVAGCIVHEFIRLRRQVKRLQ